MRENKIAMVLALDLRDAHTTNAAWNVISKNSDYLGRNFILSTLFKVPARAFANSREVLAALPGGGPFYTPNFQPVYNTGDIAPGAMPENLLTFGGVNVGPAPTGYGSEQAVIQSLRDFENDPDINVVAVEIQIKKLGGILTDVLSAAKTDSRTGRPKSVTVFSPYADYYKPEDINRVDPLFFTTIGYCCVRLSDFFYDGSTFNQPSDTEDNRGSLLYLNAQGFNSITADNPLSYDVQLRGIGKRNISRMQSSTTPIRLMPLGASITYGTGSSDGNGYRSKLYDGLKGVTTGVIDFVGRIQNPASTMADKDNEGRPGQRIDEVLGEARCAVPTFKPNVVTLLVGTNDMVQDFQVGGAPDRLGQLIDQILVDSPKATVLVSTVPPNTDASKPGINARTSAFNAALPGMVALRRASGKNVLLVDPGLTAADVGPDHIHPTDGGYLKIAQAFLQRVEEASRVGLLNDPEANSGNVAAGCAGLASTSSDARWEDHGVSFEKGFPQGSSFRFGDVNGDKKPEFFVVDQSQGWQFFWNGGRSANGWNVWAPGVKRAPRKPGLVGNALRLADLDGDGHADCVTVDLNGRLPFVGFWDESKPVGQKQCGRQGKLNWDVPGTGKIDPDTRIVFADLNGDKKDDYILVGKNGAASVWINSFTVGSLIPVWTKMEALDANYFLPPGWIANWADINADGRADQINVSPKGGATVWLNTGGISPVRGNTGQGIVYSAVTLCKVGEIMADKNLPPQDMRFVDVGGDGAADLVRVGWTGVMHIWLNRLNAPYRSTPLGANCPKIPGTGAKAAVLNGPENNLAAQSVTTNVQTGDTSEPTEPLPDDPPSPYNLLNTDPNTTVDQGSDEYQGSDVDQDSLSD